MRILLVEDDPMIGQAVKAALVDDLHVVEWLTDGLRAQQAIQTQTFDMILLDLGLPSLDGLTLLKRMRQAHNGTPCIILTARDALEDRLAGLDAGADDYLIKPFHMSELIARMRAVTRRENGETTNHLDNGVLRLDLDKKIAHINGIFVELSRREFALLQALMTRPGAILSRHALEEIIYDAGELPESNAVEFLIHSLRRKLGNEIIKNVRGLGWRVAPRE